MRTIIGALFVVSFVFCLPAFALGVVVIDPGHGGYDFGLEGATGASPGGLREKDVSLSVARALSEQLKKGGKSAVLTRDIDRHLSLQDRALMANGKKPDIFISIHLSGSAGSADSADSDVFYVYVGKAGGAEGGEVLQPRLYYSLSSGQMHYIERSRQLSAAVEKALLDEFGIDGATGPFLEVVHREMGLPVLNSLWAPAILIEIPLKKLTDIERIASAIANGVAAFGDK